MKPSTSIKAQTVDTERQLANFDNGPKNRSIEKIRPVSTRPSQRLSQLARLRQLIPTVFWWKPVELEDVNH